MESIIERFIPSEWTYQSGALSCHLVELDEYTQMYANLKQKVSRAFNLGVRKIARVENPYLWAQYLLRKEEYQTNGVVRELELFHDTSSHNVQSIVETNLDWRRAHRVKYGRGVSFSPSPAYANSESCRSNGTDRALIVAKVLVQNSETVATSVKLPSKGYDTTVGNCGNVYVKFYDDEFYPNYIIYYTSRRRR
ncbi:hypothetical protein PPYR_10412 [Photinus pyralis]|uniref:Poly [ADP-ribose] polymerase n=1 Tax=Photinus pyralis TaxID=7054 RepID=A0A1Y1KRR0_PHOPY|nr:protein mono-ADP-ribosyltransferase PARP12-like [Photinus pyralis]KAB0796351.1 hypothetical protein PPYR_10412 [Photinus pyralis]